MENDIVWSTVNLRQKGFYLLLTDSDLCYDAGATRLVEQEDQRQKWDVKPHRSDPLQYHHNGQLVRK